MALDDKVGENGQRTISDSLVNASTPNPEASLIRREATGLVRQAMDKLTDRQRTVIALRYGIRGNATLTLGEIGRVIGVSHETVRQIECQAKVRLLQLFKRSRGVRAPARRPYPARRLVPKRPTS